MRCRARTLEVMPPSIQPPTTEADSAHASTDTDAPYELVVGRPGTGRDVVTGAR